VALGGQLLADHRPGLSTLELTYLRDIGLEEREEQEERRERLHRRRES
jgi:hypothetical protein